MVLERLNFKQNGQVDSKKNKKLVENLREMNQWFYTYSCGT
jgi:hypothetical protein